MQRSRGGTEYRGAEVMQSRDAECAEVQKHIGGAEVQRFRRTERVLRY